MAAIFCAGTRRASGWIRTNVLRIRKKSQTTDDGKVKARDGQKMRKAGIPESVLVLSFQKASITSNQCSGPPARPFTSSFVYICGEQAALSRDPERSLLAHPIWRTQYTAAATPLNVTHCPKFLKVGLPAEIIVTRQRRRWWRPKDHPASHEPARRHFKPRAVRDPHQFGLQIRWKPSDGVNLYLKARALLPGFNVGNPTFEHDRTGFCSDDRGIHEPGAHGA